MKNLLQLIIGALFASFLFSSCGNKNEEPVHPMSGNWYLGSLNFKVEEPGYLGEAWSLYQNDPRPDWVEYFGTGNTLTLIFGTDFEKYVLNLNKDLSFDRTFQFNGPDETDEGTWELDEEQNLFFLNSSSAAFPEEYDLVGTIETNEFTLGETYYDIDSVLNDVAYDTLSQKYPLDDTLPQEEYDANLAVWKEAEGKSPAVTITYWWIFKRQ